MKYLFEKYYDENALMGDGHVNQTIYIQELQVHVKELESVISSGKPICPHCMSEMTPFNYEGYYDKHSGWFCNCEFFDSIGKYLGQYC